MFFLHYLTEEERINPSWITQNNVNKTYPDRPRFINWKAGVILKAAEFISAVSMGKADHIHSPAS